MVVQDVEGRPKCFEFRFLNISGQHRMPATLPYSSNGIFATTTKSAKCPILAVDKKSLIVGIIQG